MLIITKLNYTPQFFIPYVVVQYLHFFFSSPNAHTTEWPFALLTLLCMHFNRVVFPIPTLLVEEEEFQRNFISPAASNKSSRNSSSFSVLCRRNLVQVELQNRLIHSDYTSDLDLVRLITFWPLLGNYEGTGFSFPPTRYR